MGELGRWAILFLLFVVPYTFVMSALGGWLKRPRLAAAGRAGMIATVFLSTVASASLVALLLTDDFRYQYVVNYSSSNLPIIYKIAAFWGGSAGSLLFWTWLLSIYSLLASYLKHHQRAVMQPVVTAVLSAILFFFVLVMNAIANPFQLAPMEVAEGNSLNPMLQNPSMMVHPVNLYLGYIGFAVPYAYAIAALLTNQTGATWLKVTRRWTLVSWLFLGVGILYGSQWAYEELGWGGFWAWDPVENAALLPWLTSTAFLHSAIVQEKRGMLKGWNMVLIMVTFVLTIYGTFLTRSGLLFSVHAFASGPMGAFFLTFVGIIVIFSLAVLIWKWPLLKADNDYEAVTSKESSFMINNLLLLGSAFAIFWGTMYPIVSELITGEKMTVGAPFFNRVNIPIFIAVVVLMGIAPLLAWRRSSFRLLGKNLAFPLAVAVVFWLLARMFGLRGEMALLAFAGCVFVAVIVVMEFVKAVQSRRQMTGESAVVSFFRLFQRNRRRYGGYVVHMAVVFIVAGYAGAGAYEVNVQQMLEPGQSMQVGAYTLTYEGLTQTGDAYRTEVFADVLLEKDGQALAVMRPEKVFYTLGGQPSTEVAIYHTWLGDLYLVLGGWDEETGAAVFQAKIFPLINWVWFGMYLMMAGTLVALWPERPRLDGPLSANWGAAARGSES